MSRQQYHCPSNSFCYICGFYTSRNKRIISKAVKDRYDMYFFPVKLGDQDKSYAPHIVCANCYESLSKGAQPNKMPMSWTEQADHENYYYFFAQIPKEKILVTQKQCYVQMLRKSQKMKEFVKENLNVS